MDSTVKASTAAPVQPVGEVTMRRWLTIDGRPMEVSVHLKAVPLPPGAFVGDDDGDGFVENVADTGVRLLGKRLEGVLIDADPVSGRVAPRGAEAEPAGASGDGSLSTAADDGADAMLRSFDAIMARLQVEAAAERIAMNELATRLAAGAR